MWPATGIRRKYPVLGIRPIYRGRKHPVSHRDRLRIGIKAGDDGDVTVNGDVIVNGSDSIGVSLLGEDGKPSIVTIKGEINAQKYVIFEAGDESEEHSFEDGRFNDEVSEDCRYYTKNYESFVYVSMYAGGSGTADDPYLIANGTQLYNIGEYYFIDKHYKQIADINLGGWYSLGEDSVGALAGGNTGLVEDTYATGEVNGDGYAVGA